MYQLINIKNIISSNTTSPYPNHRTSSQPKPPTPTPTPIPPPPRPPPHHHHRNHRRHHRPHHSHHPRNHQRHDGGHQRPHLAHSKSYHSQTPNPAEQLEVRHDEFSGLAICTILTDKPWKTCSLHAVHRDKRWQHMRPHMLKVAPVCSFWLSGFSNQPGGNIHA